MKTFVYWVTCALAAGMLYATPTHPIRWETVTPEDGGATYQIGRLEVPMLHADPGGKAIELAFVRLTSTSKSPGPPVVYLSGGPGQPAIPMARSKRFVAALAPLRELGDVILLDQRGTGKSVPSLFCRYDRKQATDFLSDRYSDEKAIGLLRSCAARFEKDGYDVRAFNTRESAWDLDTLRVALGVEKIRLFGFSYGTHLALAAVRQLGDRIDRAVLVGTEGPDDTEKLPLTMDVQWKKISLLAASDPTTARDMPDLWSATERVMARLSENPLRVKVRDESTGSDVEIEVGRRGLQWLLLRDIGDTSDLPYFPALIYQIDKGETGLLEWFVSKRFNRLGGLSLMNVAMDCSSGASDERRSRIEQQAKRSVFGNEMNSAGGFCRAIGNPALDATFREPLVSDVPILFVTGTLDANTPPSQAEEIRWGLSNAVHLVVVNAGHEDSMNPPAVRNAIADFLAGRDVASARVVMDPIRFKPVSTSAR